MDDIIIKKIEIRNFRSISKINIEVDKISVLVGHNDAGKSNILRALNLFFNGQTDPNVSLNFETDFNIRGGRDRKADEISIELEFQLPENYIDTNGNFLRWKKIWRKESNTPVHDNYQGVRIVKGVRGGKKLEYIKIPPKSNLHATLRQINYRYVPANKNADFFDSLRGEIYHTISNVAKGSFHQSSKNFEQSIGKHLKKLTTDLSNSLGFESQLSLPNDLSGIFENLDFIDTANIPLKNRGDGIKARHIPHILFFMAEKQKELSVRGGPRFTTIWGYEEPENNLEMTSCSILAKEIFNYCEKGIAQTFLTTHSPIFYNVGKEFESISSTHFVYKDEANEKTLCSNEKNIENLDERMGVTQIYAEKIAGIQKDLDKLRIEAIENKKLFDGMGNKENSSRIFVEGESDKLVIEKAIKVFQGQYKDRIAVETKTSGAGHEYVIDMLGHWRSRHKHHKDEPKACGIVDEDANSQKVSWNRGDKNTESAKCFLLPKPQSFIDLDRTKFKVNLCLETLYPDQIWQHAKSKGWLEEISNKDILKDVVIEKILSNNSETSDYITDQTPCFITHKFKSNRKIQAAKYVAQQTDHKFKSQFPFFESFTAELVEYLFND